MQAALKTSALKGKFMEKRKRGFNAGAVASPESAAPVKEKRVPLQIQTGLAVCITAPWKCVPLLAKQLKDKASISSKWRQPPAVRWRPGWKVPA